MIPRNVVNFATEAHLGPYLMFQDYFNHYRSQNGAKTVEFSKVDQDGKAISFAEKETLMNAALKREILRVAGISNFDEFPLETWVTNPSLSWATFAVVNTMVDMILPNIMIDSIGMFTDIKNIGWGDSANFDIEANGLFVVSKGGRAQKRTNVHKQFKGSISILPEPRQLTVGVSLYRVLSGAESLADFVMKAVRSIEAQVTVDAYNAFATAMAALPTTATTGLQVSGYSQAALMRLAQQVQAFTGQKPVIVGTSLALLNVLPEDVNYRYELDSDYVKMGYVRTAFGYDTLMLPQVADWASPWGTVISDSYLWILAPGSQKLLKLVIEGSTLSHTDGAWDNANLSQNFTMIKSYGVGVVTNTTAGVIAL
jgi:hypothetical protein